MALLETVILGYIAKSVSCSTSSITSDIINGVADLLWTSYEGRNVDGGVAVIVITIAGKLPSLRGFICDENSITVVLVLFRINSY